MSVSVTNQLHIFLLSLAGGALAGVLFDLFRTFRKLVHTGTFWVGIQDLLFWFLAATAGFLFLYRTNYGQPRWYIFCGIVLGALFYHLLLGDYPVRFFLAFVRLVTRLCRMLFRILLFPFFVLYRILWPVCLFLWRPCRFFIRFLRRKIRNFSEKISSEIKKIKKRRKMY